MAWPAKKYKKLHKIALSIFNFMCDLKSEKCI